MPKAVNWPTVGDFSEIASYSPSRENLFKMRRFFSHKEREKTRKPFVSFGVFCGYLIRLLWLRIRRTVFFGDTDKSCWLPWVARSLVVFLAVVLASSAVGQLPTAELTAIAPLGAKAGSETELRWSAGNRLDEVEQLRFSHPGITAELATDDPLAFSDKRQPRYGHFRVKVADSVPPGRYEVRAAGRHGVSNPRLFLVHALAGGDLRTAPSSAKDSPTDLPLDTLYQSKTDAAKVHYFALHAEAEQTLRVDCLASRIDTLAIPVLTLFDAAGRTIQMQSGSDNSDPQLIIESQQAADYVLTVHDAIYRGGEEFGYVIVAQIDDQATDLVSPQDETSRWKPQPGQVPAALTANAAAVTAEMFGDVIEIEETSDAKTITPPCTLHAWFDSRDDEDVYEFSAQKGQQLVIDVVSHRIGQPTDCRVVVQRAEPQPSGDPQWKQVAIGDDIQNIGDAALKLWSADSQLTFTAPQEATYRLVLRDLDTGQTLQKSQQYFVQLRRPEPRFDLVAYRPFPAKDANSSRPIGSQLFRGGTEAIRVYCLRKDGWTGAVELTVEGLPAGVTCAPATIAANQNQAQLTLVAAEDAGKAIADIQVTGRASDAAGSPSQRATSAVITWGRGQLRESIRSRMSNDLTIAVSDKDLLPVSVSIGDGKIPEVKKGESLTLPVKLKRREGGKVNYIVRPRDLPPKVTSGDVTIAPDKDEANVVLKVAGDAPAGTYSLWLQAETKIKVKPNPQALERAQAYRAHLQKLRDDPAKADRHEAIDAAIKAADGRIAAAQGAAKDQELTLFLPSPHLSIRIVDP